MARNGLLIQYEWCTGCHACEVACKQEHDYNGSNCGIRVEEVITRSPDKVNVDFMPFTTRFCDLCIDRVKGGGEPACVKHCQSRCMMFGPVTILAKAMEDQPRSSIFAPT